MSLAKYDNKGRRQEDGSSRTTLVSPQISSPDPVEMVRQYEHDENIARMLQAQFDSQMDYTLSSPTDISESSIPTGHTGRIQVQTDDTSTSSRPMTPISFQSSNVTIELSTSGPSSTTVYYSVGDDEDSLPGGLNEISDGDDEHEIDDEDEGDDDELDEDDEELDEGDDEPDEDDDELDEDAEELEGDDIEDEDDDLDLDEEDGDEDDEDRSRLFPEDIERLPTHLATPRSSRSHECQVCLQGYAKGDELRVLPCFHQFHKSCIDPWLLNSTTCPTCRVKVDLSEQVGTI